MMQPRADRILVKPDEYLAHASEVGLVIPPRDGRIIDSQSQFGRTGTIVAVGPGKRDKNGHIHPLVCKTGDRVYWGEFQHPQYEDEDGTKYYVLQEADICGVIDHAA